MSVGKSMAIDRAIRIVHFAEVLADLNVTEFIYGQIDFGKFKFSVMWPKLTFSSWKIVADVDVAEFRAPIAWSYNDIVFADRRKSWRRHK